MNKAVWNLSHIFPDEKQIDQYILEVEHHTKAFVSKWKNNQEYTKQPQVLAVALREYEAWIREYGAYSKLGYYLSLKMALEMDNVELKARVNKFNEKAQKLLNDFIFFPLNISKIPQNHHKNFLQHKELSDFRNFLVFQFKVGKHLLSEKEERILNLKEDVSHYNWVHMLSEFLSKEEAEIINSEGQKITVSFSELTNLLSDTNKTVRDSAAAAFNAILQKHSDVAEHEINSILQNKKIEDEIKKFDKPDSARLMSDEMEHQTIDALLEAVSSRFDISKRYYELKAQLFGVKKLKYHERNVPFGELNQNYSFEDSVKLVLKAFNNIDPEFGQIVENYLKNGQIDVFPKKGKQGGAFCSHNTKNELSYILLNHSDRLQDVLTLAHECGHGINNEFIKSHQNEINFGTSTAVAEVSSTFMEDFVLDELRKTADDDQRLSLIIMKLDEDISTIFRQVACYKFELDLHNLYKQKGYLSKKVIGELFQKHMHEYMGDCIEKSKGSEDWWVYWSHIRSFFYVYSYASGLLISKSLQQRFRKDPMFINNIKQFLSAGTSMSPKEIFAKLGINIDDRNFWLEGISEVETLLIEAEALSKKLGKI